MIYNDEFVWLHFPKCAGTKIEQLFAKYLADVPGLVQDPVGLDLDPTVAWHDTVARRSERDPDFALGDRTVVCSFRRLPGWLVSRYNFEFRRSPDLEHKPELLLEGRFLEQGGFLNHADAYARNFLPPAIVESGKLAFLRTEYLEEDFHSVFSRFIDVSAIPTSAFRSKANKSGQHIPADVRETLARREDDIYASCPYWRDLEKIAYA
ncbi:MAG: hypothetical protein CSB44_10900 [Gammaproteobacteria bacterium]|nr:MAG: hypothetical protein CSB44_10900 [Gammaproteobacteria bacterium]